MATSAYLSPGPPPLSDTQEEGGVMNLVNPAVTSQSYSVPREQVVRISSTFSTWQILLLALQTVDYSRKNSDLVTKTISKFVRCSSHNFLWMV